MLPAGARVLDVGCGDGGLVERLVERGFDAHGVDPAAPADHPRLTRGSVEDLAPDAAFDAATASMSLHHGDLGAMLPAIASLLRPGSPVHVVEYAWDEYDERAAAWVAAHAEPDADWSVATWRAKRADLHRGATIAAALASAVSDVTEARTPHLARALGRGDLEDEERALIAASKLPALGRRYVGYIRKTP